METKGRGEKGEKNQIIDHFRVVYILLLLWDVDHTGVLGILLPQHGDEIIDAEYKLLLMLLL